MPSCSHDVCVGTSTGWCQRWNSPPLSIGCSHRRDASRLEKNRISAQASRERKRRALVTMAEEISVLELEKSKLEAALEATRAENVLLHERIQLMERRTRMDAA